jgi:hypothetical protein
MPAKHAAYKFAMLQVSNRKKWTSGQLENST